jgi:transcriptional antiterminator NusG
MSNLDTDTDQPMTDALPENADASTASADAEVADAEVTAVPDADVTDAEAADADVDADLEGSEQGETSDTETSETETSDTDQVTDGDVEVVTGDELIEQQPVRVESPYDRPGRWFVVHTQSGYEKKVKQNLEARIVSMNAEEAVYEVVIPMEDYVDFKNGKRVVAQRKMFPGYLLVRAHLDDTAWFVIRNTPGVTGFVGQGAKPSPLPRRDVEAFLVPKGGEAEPAATRAKPRLEYETGETVRVKEGPFADFSGEVIEINEDQLKLKVLVNIFGRETPVELEFSKVAKL